MVAVGAVVSAWPVAMYSVISSLVYTSEGSVLLDHRLHGFKGSDTYNKFVLESSGPIL
jgi:hypothetical protein